MDKKTSHHKQRSSHKQDKKQQRTKQQGTKDRSHQQAHDYDHEKWVQAYEKMLQRMKVALDEMEEKTAPVVHEQLEKAKETAVELGELTAEEAQRIAGFIKRDLTDLGQFFEKTGKSFNDWFYFDWKAIESNLWDTFNSVVDKSRAELMRWHMRFQNIPDYRTGDVTSPGTLRCVDCDELIHFKKISPIPPCPKCHGTNFVRSSNNE